MTRDVSHLQSRPDQFWSPHSLLCGGYRALAHGVKWPGCEANHSPNLVLSLRMRGVTPLLPSMLSWHAQEQFSHIT
jgi:hypothetical protein